MIIKNKKSAFSLTELLIVMVVIAFLFAAMAPVITKRKAGGGDFSNEAVWNYVTGDTNMDAYFDPGVSNWASIAFIGLSKPYNLGDADKKSGGKLTIRANEGQHQIQFRYGDNSGLYAGSLFVNGSNMLMGTGFNTGGSNLTAAGINIAGSSLSNSTVLGSYTAFNAPKLDSGSRMTVIGANSARDFSSSSTSSAKVWNVFVGANTGKTEYTATDAVGVGYNALSGTNLMGGRNTAIGTSTGSSLTSGEENVFAGTQFAGKTSSYNTIVGYETYKNKNPNIKNLTAIGVGACDSITNSTTSASGAKTCIGYSSASDSNGTNDYYNDVDSERIFIGGNPLGGFTGRSVLEVHNINSEKNSSVVLNSNLVLRGNLYTMWPMTTDVWTNSSVVGYTRTSVSKSAWERYCSSDNCRRAGGLVGKKKYRTWPWQCLTHKKPVSSNYMKSKNATSFSYSMSGDYPNLSDIKLKENITENDDGLEKILAIKPYNYTFKDDKTQKAQVGVIAQDLMKIFPNAVSKAKDGYYRIRWDEMFYAMVNAIKTLNQKVEQIVSDVANISKDIKNLSDSNKKIKKRIVELNARAAKLEKK